ncbi:ribonuclease D [Parvularcula sp. LCG005]|uniref:ribonuclease D n=1 Tax=Parvularcula sp. LCG005 TaxID=3078805 RepID=UPI00294248B1|nr:ribonuclease D [Parvularcula sp. LCG005]WOI54655.1 ribonuclease D [Parvularcula sp. LCG005]
MQVIEKTEDLRRLCEVFREAPFVTVDTEFMRERTYYSQLCLIQVATTEDAAIIDPLAPGIDLEPLLALLADESVVKVFHAARQDLEIFYRLMGRVPQPLFDTQIAAMACGYGDQVGYEPLVRAVTGAQVDKGSRFTDWSKRPLSEKQLTYALGDVTHLVDVYLALQKKLAETGRTAWVAEEMAVLDEPTLYFTSPETAWQRLKLRNIRPKDMGAIVQLAAWREREAQQKDVPRARVVKDEAITEIARAAPTTVAELGALRGVPTGFERSRSAAGLLEAVAAGKAMSRDDIPQKETSGQNQPAPADVVDLLRVLLKRQSELHGVAPKLLASSADIEAIALSDDANVPAMRGWRREVFGDLALKLKHGAVSLGLKGKSVTLINHKA